MQRIDSGTGVAAAKPAYDATSSPGYFAKSPGTTIVSADFLNGVQEELAGVVALKGAALNKADDTQLATVLGPVRALDSDATDTGTVTSVHTRAVVGSAASKASGAESAVVASSSSTATGSPSAVVAGNSSTATGIVSAAIAATGANVAGANSAAVAIASTGTIPSGASGCAILAATDATAGGSGKANAVVIASTQSVGTLQATGNQSIVAAADDGQATGDKSAVIASDTSTATGTESMAAASQSSNATGLNSLVGAASGADATGARSAVIAAALDTRASGLQSMTVASQECENGTNSSIGGGDTGVGITPTGTPTNREMTWRIESVTGTGRFAAGTTTAGLDYAEMFPNARPGALPIGSLVSRAPGARAVRLAHAGQRVIGVVSANPSVLGGAADLGWAGKYVRDEFGAIQDGERPDGTTGPMISADYDPAREYLARAARAAEWTKVGLLGQLAVCVDSSVQPDDFVEPGSEPGRGRQADGETRIECMEITSPYDPARGYAVALCLVR